jgi:hypothetical protein
VIRRAVIALVAVLGLTSCSTLSSNDDVASVGSHELTRDDLQSLLDSDLSAEVLRSQVVDGEASGDSARTVISAWLLLTAAEDAGAISRSDTADIETTLQSAYENWDAGPQVMKDLLIADQLLGAKAQDGTLGQDALIDIMAAADIEVDARYGYWDPAAGNFGSVVGFD